VPVSPAQAVPPVNVYEGNGQLSVAIPIPGAHPQHVEVVVTPESVRLRAPCKYPQENQHYHRRDWQVGAWEAEVSLPQRIDPARSRATLNLGVLVVMAPVAPGGNGGEYRPAVE
jgi:HSP20 family molecular chaperone IbpA